MNSRIHLQNSSKQARHKNSVTHLQLLLFPKTLLVLLIFSKVSFIEKKQLQKSVDSESLSIPRVIPLSSAFNAVIPSSKDLPVLLYIF